MADRTRSRLHFMYEVLYEAGVSFGEHRANRMAAAIAYRAMFAAAPMLLIATAIVGPIIGENVVQQEIFDAVEAAFGSEVAESVQVLLQGVLTVNSSTAIIGGILLFWTSSSLFLEMQHDLNDIFDVPYEFVSGLVSLAKKRGIGFLWAFALGLGLIGIWLLNVVWRFLDHLFPENLTTIHRILAYVTPLLSFVLLPLVFALIFQTMTVVKVRWRAVWWGGLITAAMFLVSAYGIGLYFQIFDQTNAASIAASFFVVLLLAYLLSTVFLYGAEVTKAYDAYLETGDIAGSRFLTKAPAHVVGSESEPTESSPTSRVTVFAFLSGLLIGWWKRRD